MCARECVCETFEGKLLVLQRLLLAVNDHLLRILRLKNSRVGHDVSGLVVCRWSEEQLLLLRICGAYLATDSRRVCVEIHKVAHLKKRSCRLHRGRSWWPKP